MPDFEPLITPIGRQTMDGDKPGVAHMDSPCHKGKGFAASYHASVLKLECYSCGKLVVNIAIGEPGPDNRKAIGAKYMNRQSCETPDCKADADHHAMVVAGRCHHPAPTRVSYHTGNLHLNCGRCTKEIVTLAVGNDWESEEEESLEPAGV